MKHTMIALVLSLLMGTPVLAQGYQQPGYQQPGYQQPGYQQPGYQPQQPAPAYQPRRATRYSRYRTNWYIGLGIGGGLAWVNPENAPETEGEGGVSGVFKVGSLINPQLAIGLDWSFWYKSEDNGYDTTVWVMFNHFDAVLTFYPAYDQGFFVKGGLGIGAVTLGRDYDDGYYDESDSESEYGVDLKLGAGYEFQLARSFNMGVDVTFAATKYDGGTTKDLTFNLMFMWF